MSATTSTAIVIGGSMAGLLAARVLSDSFDRVLILERDIVPESAAPRKGVPQAQHAHALLAGGAVAIEELFPGILGEMVMAGAPRGHGRFFSGGGYHLQDTSDSGGLFASRPFLEHVVRQRVRQIPNVEILEGCDVSGLMVNDARDRVTGVEVKRDNGSAMPGQLPADLVVDASGRGSRTPAWLESMGYEPPAVEVVEVGMGYSTRLYRREPEHLGGDAFVNIAPSPDNPRASGMMSQEGDRWIVTLAGYHGDHPPTDEQGFLEFAKTLPTQDVYSIVSTATPLSDAVAYRFRSNQWRHYERLARFPDGLLVIGDAIASFTPIYGQGMSVAAREALALRACLSAGTSNLSQRFFREAAVTVSWAWTITVGNDASLLGPSVIRDPTPAPIRWYLRNVQTAASRNLYVSSAFRQVGMLLAPPTSLMRPAVAARVLWTMFRPQPKRGTEAPTVETATASARA